MVCCFYFVHIEYAIHSPSFHDSNILVVVLFAMRLSTTGHMILPPLNQILIRISFSYFFARMQYHDCWFLSKKTTTEQHRNQTVWNYFHLSIYCDLPALTESKYRVGVQRWRIFWLSVYTSICDVTAGTQNRMSDIII